MADFIGLDVVRDVMDYLLPDVDPALRTPDLLRELVAAGRLGSKSGAGFYDYAERAVDERLTERDAKLAGLLKAGAGGA